MGSLFSALNSASSALTAFERAVDVTQENVANANTPGYAAQDPTIEALQFGPDGLSGGVVEQTQDSRNPQADAAVQQQLSLVGQFQQLQTSLQPLETVFDVSSSSPIPSALTQLFQSFSQWSSQPSSADYQTAVIDAAQQTASAFQQAAAQLASIQNSNAQDIQSAVAQINQDATEVQAYNVAMMHTGAPDAGLSAKLESSLENLSNYANVQLLPGVGGTVTVLLGGQTPLVIGDQVDALSIEPAAAAESGAPNIAILDSNGNDVTSQVTSGSLSALLNVQNTVLPSLAGGGQQAGALNTLAQSVADTVNNLLEQGSTTSTQPYQAGTPLFTYTANQATGVAASLAVNPAITPSQLAAVQTGPPLVSNGVALQLAALDNAPQGALNGQSFTQYFATLVSQVGNAAGNAATSATAQQQVLTQAQTLQQQLSGVSLDDEAVQLVQLQSAYQAASKVVTIVDQMTQDLMNMVPA
ncbi:MAG: flagellar hook-associated protein FlgK [Bryobacteraceae bacterium]